MGSAGCMVQGAARAAIYSSYRVLKGLLLCYYARYATMRARRGHGIFHKEGRFPLWPQGPRIPPYT